MREIKFEYMLIKDGIVINKQILTLEDIEQKDSDEFCYELLEQNEKVIKRQYTGLKDKNGVEIYEGDVCKTVHSAFRDDDNTIGIVEFYNGRFSRKIKYPSGQYNYHDLFNFHCEVIGNIYEDSHQEENVEMPRIKRYKEKS